MREDPDSELSPDAGRIGQITAERAAGESDDVEALGHLGRAVLGEVIGLLGEGDHVCARCQNIEVGTPNYDCLAIGTELVAVVCVVEAAVNLRDDGLDDIVEEDVDAALVHAIQGPQGPRASN